MNEQQRMQYLDAMGIDMFVPRYILPNALPSSLCLLPSAPKVSVSNAATRTITSNNVNSDEAPTGVHSLLEAVSEAPSAKGDVSADHDAESISTLNSAAFLTHSDSSDTLESDSSQRPKKDIAPPIPIDISSVTESLHHGDSSTPDITSAEDQNREPAHFLLQLWRINEDLLVIDSKVQDEPLPTDTLLVNLLAGMKLHRGALPQADKLQWPLVNSASKDKSWHAAQEMTHYFLEGRLFTSPVKYIFLCGDLAQKAILKQPIMDDATALNLPSEAACQKVSVDAFACEAYCFPSLNAVLKAPMLKRYIWRMLSKSFTVEL